MNIERFFQDPRRVRSQELTALADRAEDDGDLAAELGYYAEAARLEEANALDVPAEASKVRTLLAISAVALWLRAERWDDAARAGCLFLSQPEKLTPDGPEEIRKLVDRAWRTSEVQRTLGPGAVFVPVEATLSGGLVRQGLAPSVLVAERRDVLAPLLVRVAEWQSHKKYRRAGPSTLASSYEILEAPAIAGSYGLRLYVGSTSAQIDAGAAASPKDVVEQFLALAGAVASDPEELRRIVGDSAYATAFLRGFRDLAPDGKAVGQVALGAMVRGRISQAAALTVETRQSLTHALRRRGEEKSAIVTLEGVLKSVNLRGDAPRIGIDTEAGMRVFRIAKGEHDDTIGPKLNRSVRILGMRRVNDAGEADDWADDVTLIEDAADERPS
jgi:hypothetical protein